MLCVQVEGMDGTVEWSTLVACHRLLDPLPRRDVVAGLPQRILKAVQVAQHSVPHLQAGQGRSARAPRSVQTGKGPAQNNGAGRRQAQRSTASRVRARRGPQPASVVSSQRAVVRCAHLEEEQHVDGAPASAGQRQQASQQAVQGDAQLRGGIPVAAIGDASKVGSGQGCVQLRRPQDGHLRFEATCATSR